MGTNRLFKVTDYPSLELQLQVKKNQQLGNSGRLPERRSLEAQSFCHESKGPSERWKRKQWRYFFPSREQGKIPLCVAKQGQ